MIRKRIALAAGVVGLFTLGWAVATLLRYRSFTEASEGVVQRRDGGHVVIRFDQQHSSPNVQFSGYQQHVFPPDRRTEGLRPGDRVIAYHPPRQLGRARFDRDFSYGTPAVTAAVGVLLLATATALFLRGSARTAPYEPR